MNRKRGIQTETSLIMVKRIWRHHPRFTAAQVTLKKFNTKKSITGIGRLETELHEHNLTIGQLFHDDSWTANSMAKTVIRVFYSFEYLRML